MAILKRAAVAAILSGFLASSAFAAQPLPSGKAAGTREAAMTGPGIALWLGVAGVLAWAAIAASNDNKGSTTTTASTGTTP